MKINFNILSLIALLSTSYAIGMEQEQLTVCPQALLAKYPPQHKNDVLILLTEASYQDIFNNNAVDAATRGMASNYYNNQFRKTHPMNLQALALALPYNVKELIIADVTHHYPHALPK